jgi:hypothetical protein
MHEGREKPKCSTDYTDYTDFQDSEENRLLLLQIPLIFAICGAILSSAFVFLRVPSWINKILKSQEMSQ